MSGAPDPNKIRVMLSWLRRLAEVTSAQNLTPPTAEKLALLADMLGDEFRSSDFSRPSLGHVAAKFAWFPAYSELRAALLEWREAEDLAAKYDHMRGIEGGAGEPQTQAEKAEAERAWLAKDWNNPEGVRRNIRTCQGEARFLRMLAGLVARHAPQHMALIDPRHWPEWHKAEAANE